MSMVTKDARASILTIINAISQHPESWSGWGCLRIDAHHLTSQEWIECQKWMSAVLKTYLHKFESRTFFCDKQDVHILCRYVDKNMLENIGGQICDVIVTDHPHVTIDYTIYDLGTQGQKYADQFRALYGVFPHIKIQDAVSTIASEHTFTKQERDVKGHYGQPKVLLVEDDPVTRWMVRSSLKDVCQLVMAGSANTAFHLFSSIRPDVVFLDINLPDKNGLSVLEWMIRNDPGASIVMFSSENDIDNITHAIACGAKGFVSKPFLKDNLLAYIRVSEIHIT